MDGESVPGYAQESNSQWFLLKSVRRCSSERLASNGARHRFALSAIFISVNEAAFHHLVEHGTTRRPHRGSVTFIEKSASRFIHEHCISHQFHTLKPYDAVIRRSNMKLETLLAARRPENPSTQIQCSF